MFQFLRKAANIVARKVQSVYSSINQASTIETRPSLEKVLTHNKLQKIERNIIRSAPDNLYKLNHKDYVTKKLNEIIQIYDDIYDYLPSEDTAEEVYLDKWHIVDFRDDCEKVFDVTSNTKVIDSDDY